MFFPASVVVGERGGLLGVSCAGIGVGLDDLCGSFPTQDIL